MGNYIPGNPDFLPVNMPDAGGIVATNYLHSIAPKDGFAVAIFSRNLPTQALCLLRPTNGTVLDDRV